MSTFFQFLKVNSPILIAFSLFLECQAFAAISIGMVFDKGGKGDRSFNQAAYEGLMRVKNELKETVKTVKYVEATDDSAFEPLVRSFASKNFDLIISIGVSQSEAVKKMATQYQNVRFAIVDAEVVGPNIKSLVFEEQEGSFVVGAIAAQVSKTETVGFIGGMDIPLIRRFGSGFAAGAKYIKPNAKVISNYVGVTADAWNNPAKGKELALAQYNAGAQVIFAAAGASGIGVFDAAEEKKKLAIGVDSNQNWIKPGYVLTSMVKHVEQAVFTTSKEVAEGKFQGGVFRFGLANKGVGYTLDQYNKNLLPEAVIKRTDKMIADIIAGKIQIPDYYKTKK